MAAITLGVACPAEDEIQRLFTIAGYFNLISKLFPAQSMQGQFKIVGIVFNQQNLNIVLTHQSPRCMSGPVFAQGYGTGSTWRHHKLCLNRASKDTDAGPLMRLLLFLP